MSSQMIEFEFCQPNRKNRGKPCIFFQIFTPLVIHWMQSYVQELL